MSADTYPTYSPEPIMRAYMSLALLTAVISAAACRSDESLVPEPEFGITRQQDHAELVVTEAERSLQARILSTVDPRNRSAMAQALAAGKPLRMYSNPTVDSLLQLLTKERLKASISGVSQPALAYAEVALLDSLPFRSAKAVVLRRVGQTPHDVILLTRTATVADFYAGSAMLSRLRARDGDVPTREIAVSVRGGRRTWRDGRDAAAAGLLQRLRAADATILPGFGRARHEQVAFAATKR